jgi:hypothetical protein
MLKLTRPASNTLFGTYRRPCMLGMSVLPPLRPGTLQPPALSATFQA